MDEDLMSYLNPQQSFDPRNSLVPSLQNLGLGNQPMQEGLLKEGLPQEAGFMDGFGMKEGVGAGLGALKALLSYQSLQEGKRQNRQSNAMALANLGNSAKMTNAQLYDRQVGRVAQDESGSTMSAADYISKFGVSGTV